MPFTNDELAYFERPVMRIHPEVIWSWGINPDAEKHFAGMIERRTVGA